MSLLENFIYMITMIIGVSIFFIGLQNMIYKRKKANNELDPNKSFVENFFSAEFHHVSLHIMFWFPLCGILTP